MKKTFFILFFPVTLFFACNKNKNNCTETGGVPSTAEITNLQNYLTSKSIVATQDPRGFFYQVVGPGYGADYPNIASTVTVRYKGTLTDNSVFDSTAAGATAAFPLSNVVLGWQYGIPLVKKGGVINLYLPPSLGYGCSSYPGIPSNSILIFNVEVVNY